MSLSSSVHVIARSMMAILALPVSATAADIPIRYTVSDSALKSLAASAPVSFELYAEATCTGTPVYQTTAPASSLDLVSRLKLFKAKGDTTPPPKTAEIVRTLNGVTASGNLYLRVAGAGVEAVGGECQAQAGLVHAAPSGLSLTVVDANGELVGIPTCISYACTEVTLATAFGPVVVGWGNSGAPKGIDVYKAGEGGAPELFFESNDCSGEP